MDLNTLRSVVTVLSFAVFLGIVAWAFARGNRERFDAAAALPLEGEGAALNNMGGTHE